MAIRRKHIRQVVQRILEECGIEEPPVDVRRVARHLGATVREAEADDELSGFLHRVPSTNRVIIGVNDAHSPSRQHFTIAHELGHLLLHGTEDFHVDRGFQVYRRDARSTEGSDTSEVEANLFAAELLMPIAFVAADLREREAIDLSKDDELKRLARRYRVSPQAMTFRLANLGYLTL